ncbi:MAG: DUF167 domain-containing protein [Chloroflexi bacterium]|nr:DUF167 domain-containing protein [Chloroflexota bacterium]
MLPLSRGPGASGRPRRNPPYDLPSSFDVIQSGWSNGACICCTSAREKSDVGHNTSISRISIVAYARISVHVKPGAQKSQILGFKDEYLELRVAAPPEKGKANDEVVALLARSLGIPKADVTILSGATSRRKLVGIAGLDKEEAGRRLSGKR